MELVRQGALLDVPILVLLLVKVDVVQVVKVGVNVVVRVLAKALADLVALDIWQEHFQYTDDNLLSF